MTAPLNHLQRLEAESIHILREVMADAENPVMLYSIGKDSAVMLHLAMKAFYPSKPPFPLMHIDTTWKFKEMITFRDEYVAKMGLDLIVYTNQEGVKQGVGPFTHGSSVHTDIMKTQALKQALDKYKFDAAFGGARRDEEKSRAKERVFSFRTPNTPGTPRTNVPSFGTSTTVACARASPSACSPYPTGPSKTSGNTSIGRTSRSCPCTTRPSARSSSVTACSSWSTTTAFR